MPSRNIFRPDNLNKILCSGRDADNLILDPNSLRRKFAPGFSLIEILVVIGLVAAVMTLGLFMSMDTMRGTHFRSEQQVQVSALMKARSRAISNVHQSAWGVCYAAPGYIIFRGQTYAAGAATNETVAGDPGVGYAALPGSFACGSGAVVFSQLAGTTTPIELALTQAGRTATTTIHYEGTIIW
jgi:prepilin-type N-terminal cleavage/methylation domain-containing protein